MNITELREEIIGRKTFIETPYGKRVITYADYTASGKTLKFIEKYMIKLQELYANSHTEENFTGKTMTKLVKVSEDKIKKAFNAQEDDYIIPVGTGATGAISKLANILGVYVPPTLKENMDNSFKTRTSGKCENDCIGKFEEKIMKNAPVVFISPYEHHSNDLIWRESLAEVVEINLNEDGYFDLDDLRMKITKEEYKDRLKIGSFSAASNVTGIISPVYEIAKILHENEAYACFDFAASGPYVEIDMNKDDKSYFDAVYLSPHKFLGGPGSSGILVINKAIYNENASPTVAGGGTVDYVSSLGYDFVHDVEAREKAGTPGILQILRAALAIELKDKITVKKIEKKEHGYMKKVFDRLLENPKISILGPHDYNKRVSIMSFNIVYDNGYLHHKLVTKLLNDLFGIQSRSGCACAGPYGHRLLKVDEQTSLEYRNVVLEGFGSLKPGWVRVNFHYTITEEELNFMCDAIEFVANYGYLFVNEYKMDMHSGMWTHKDYVESNDTVDNFGIDMAIKMTNEDVFKNSEVDHSVQYGQYLKKANGIAERLLNKFEGNFTKFDDFHVDKLRWYPISKETT